MDLWVAAREGNLAKVKELIEHHVTRRAALLVDQSDTLNAAPASISSSIRKGELGYSALHFASSGGHSAIIELLLTVGGANVGKIDRVGRTALHVAAANGRPAALACLLNHCATNRCELIFKTDKGGETILHHAARAGCIGCCRTVLLAAKRHCNIAGLINATTKGKGDTALILAASWGHEDCMRLLCDEHDADQAMTTRNGWNAARWLQAWFAKQKKSGGGGGGEEGRGEGVVAGEGSGRRAGGASDGGAGETRHASATKLGKVNNQGDTDLRARTPDTCGGGVDASNAVDTAKPTKKRRMDSFITNPTAPVL
jgi:ankyrin repeat protein